MLSLLALQVQKHNTDLGLLVLLGGVALTVFGRFFGTAPPPLDALQGAIDGCRCENVWKADTSIVLRTPVDRCRSRRDVSLEIRVHGQLGEQSRGVDSVDQVYLQEERGEGEVRQGRSLSRKALTVSFRLFGTGSKPDRVTGDLDNFAFLARSEDFVSDSLLRIVSIQVRGGADRSSHVNAGMFEDNQT